MERGKRVSFGTRQTARDLLELLRRTKRNPRSSLKRGHARPERFHVPRSEYNVIRTLRVRRFGKLPAAEHRRRRSRICGEWISLWRPFSISPSVRAGEQSRPFSDPPPPVSVHQHTAPRRSGSAITTAPNYSVRLKIQVEWFDRFRNRAHIASADGPFVRSLRFVKPEPTRPLSLRCAAPSNEMAAEHQP